MSPLTDLAKYIVERREMARDAAEMYMPSNHMRNPMASGMNVAYTDILDWLIQHEVTI